MLDGAVLAVKDVVLTNTRAKAVGASPGLDLLAPTPVGQRALLQIDNGIIITRFCVPYSYVAEYLRSTKRPDDFSGPNLFFSMPQPDCVNSTTAPYEDRCWPSRNMHTDVAVDAVDIAPDDTQVRSNYAVWIRNVSFVCNIMLSEDCMTHYGPAGCISYTLGTLRPPPPPAVEAQQPRASPGLAPAGPSAAAADGPASPPGSSGYTALVAGLVGGLGGAALLALASAGFLLRRRLCRGCGAGRLRGAEGGARESIRGLRSSTCRGDGMSASNTKATSLLGPGSCGANTTGTVNVSLYGVGAADCLKPPATVVCSETTATDDTSLAQSMGGHPCMGEAPTAQPRFHGPTGASAGASSGAGLEPAPPVVVSELTPAREDVCLGVECGNEVQLLGTVLGKGGYGRVMEGTYNGQVVAVKLIESSPLWPVTPTADSTSHLSALQQEVEVLARCDHPNVVRLLAANLSPPRPCLVMERCETSLERLLYGGGAPGSGARLPLSTVLHIGTEVARGLAFLHPTILHRDLKPANVLVNNAASERPDVKLTDFGLARLRCTVLVTGNPEVGTPPYMAPECFEVNNFIVTHKADMYSFGVLLAEMLAGSAPWPRLRMMEIAYQVTLRKQRPPLLEGLGEERCPRKLRRLISGCWESDPQRRPAAEDAVKVLLLLLQQQRLAQGQPGTGSSSHIG
ncbi:hypothetical protein GPECTOR_27g707 [Gonium pectorale]|uniref:Protein kinase domain-containing protein n=1 Tax=Gonium pectorale TaxID=33097 RepID=A0A150GFE3_GONPE|nr:hypothetical protein GPECTOR_27g707 [Gonium pectorale]|eukprot:KXZ48536.1 hypothetical protein GPECTOR_27g707 [Gonium pectorale]